MPEARCHTCGTAAQLPTDPADSTSVVAEPKGWTVLTVCRSGTPIASHRLCPKCWYPIRTLLANKVNPQTEGN